MTAAANPTKLETSSRLEPVQVTGGGQPVLRGMKRVAGAGLAVMAFGMWVVPGSSYDAELIIPKLVVSLTALGAGFLLMQSGPAEPAPVAQIDPIRREVRLVSAHAGEDAEILQRTAFSDLSRVDRKGNRFRLFGPDHALMADVVLSCETATTSLARGLQDAGKLS